MNLDTIRKELKSPGRAIGVFDNANLTEQKARLGPGDALVLYTDGVHEARFPNGASLERSSSKPSFISAMASMPRPSQTE
jgi:serine phosphatase RsbU (regulator of sigma subunit)